MKKLLFYTTVILAILYSYKPDDITPTSNFVDNIDNLAISALAFDQTNTMWVGTTFGIFQLKLGQADIVATAISTDLVSNSNSDCLC